MRGRQKQIGIGLSIALAVVVGCLIGYLWNSHNVSEAAAKHKLLAKRIQIKNPNEVLINFKDLRNQYINYIDSLPAGATNNVALYFEYLPTGIEISLNEKSTYAAASLMKTPYVMDAFKAGELKKIDLDKEIPLQPEWLNSEYGTLYQKGAGYKITVREAARLAMKDSDNTAILLIQHELKNANIPQKDSAFNNVDIDYDSQQDGRVLIGPRSYSSILKCLYLACYNSQNDSQEILSYLTESTFSNRLTAQLPTKLKVAHKIGTYANEYQSDCGIVYVEKKNYSLCIMVNGKDPQSSQIISDLSKITYDYIQAAQPK